MRAPVPLRTERARVLGKSPKKTAAVYLENHPLSRIDTLSRSQTMI